MAMARTGLIGVVAGLIIGAAIFIYVSTTLLTGLKSSTTTATFNTTIDSMVTISFTVGTLMSIAAIAVVGFWVVRNVIGGN